MDRTADFYSRPSHEFRGGAGFPVFSGSRRQRGGGIFGTLAKFFTPIAKNVGKSLLVNGIDLAKNVAHDAMQGRNIGESLKRRGKASAIRFGKSVARQGVKRLSNMIGKGSRQAPRRRKRRNTSRKRTVKRPRRSSTRKSASRKRRAPSKSTHKRKPKRRRIAANF